MDPDIRPIIRPKTKTSSFKTPEEVAAEERLEPVLNHVYTSQTEDQPVIMSGATNWRDKLKPHWPLQQREWVTTMLIVLIGGFGIFAVLSHHGSKPVVSAQPVKKAVLKVAPKPTTVASTLSGLEVAPALMPSL